MKYWIFFLSLWITIACGSEAERRGLLNREEYAALLVDLSVVEASVSRVMIIDSSITGKMNERTAYVLKKHGITRAKMLETADYYYKNKVELIKVYELAMEQLQKRTESIKLAPDSVAQTW